jgi:hypothetical protein
MARALPEGTITRECAVFGSARGRRSFAAAAKARAFTLDQIRALAAVARAGGQQQDAQCRAAAVRAGHLGAAAIDAVVHADQARERALRAVGAHAADDPAVQENYQRVATATLEARHSVTRTITTCPDLAAPHR